MKTYSTEPSLDDLWYVKKTACFPACWKVTKDGRGDTDIGDNATGNFFRTLGAATEEKNRRNALLGHNIYEFGGSMDFAEEEPPSDTVSALVDELEEIVQRAQQILVVLEGRGRTVQWTKDSLSDISNDIEELKQGLR